MRFLSTLEHLPDPIPTPRVWEGDLQSQGPSVESVSLGPTCSQPPPPSLSVPPAQLSDQRGPTFPTLAPWRSQWGVTSPCPQLPLPGMPFPSKSLSVQILPFSRSSSNAASSMEPQDPFKMSDPETLVGSVQSVIWWMVNQWRGLEGEWDGRVPRFWGSSTGFKS